MLLIATHPPTESYVVFDFTFGGEASPRAGETGVPLIRVVASDTFEPVPDVMVEITLIGPDGGDGGYQVYLTNADGNAPLYVPLGERHH